MISKKGVASHRPDEMAIHVDENVDAHAHAGPADGDAHDDIDANVDDIRPMWKLCSAG